MSKIAFLFPGQGSQKPGMVRKLYEELDPLDKTRLEKAFPGIGQAALSEEKADTDRMAAQLVYLSGLLSARLLQSQGIEPDYLAGFSLGEITALTFSEVLPQDQAFDLLALRSRAMDEACAGQSGAMAAVNGLDAPSIEAILAHHPQTWAVNYNSPRQTVISGEADAIGQAVGELKNAGAKVIGLNVKGAFHTPFMAHASAVLDRELTAMDFGAFRYPVLSNLDGAVYPAETTAIRDRIARQVVSPVRFTAMVEALYDQGVRIFIEAGFGKTLQGLVGRILPQEDIFIGGLSDRAGLALLKEKLEGNPFV